MEQHQSGLRADIQEIKWDATHVRAQRIQWVLAWTSFSAGALGLSCQGRMHLSHHCDPADLWLMGRNCQITGKLSFPSLIRTG